jgi:DHA2 family multidrug resistance protein
VRDRIAGMTDYLLRHGLSDAAAARHEAIMAIGNIVRRQALTMGFSDAFGAIGVMLTLAAIAVLFARKVSPAAGAGAH